MHRFMQRGMVVLFAGLCFLLSGMTALAQDMPSDYQEVLKSLDRKGDFKAGVLKVNIPRNDLKITIQGVSTPTPFGFGGWVALTKGTEGTDVMMGDLVLLQEEVNPVMSALLDNGIDITALHNHFFWDDPHVFFMHVHGHGKAADLARRVKLGLDLIVGPAPEATRAITVGRPVTDSSVPTAQRARRLVYAPDLDGRADPGEIVWTWVVYEDDPSRGKDRPVLVVGRDRNTLLGLMMSSQDHHRKDRDWVGIGSGSWDNEGRPSWVRLDRVLDVPEEGIRREGAILERKVFEVVAARLRAEYSWS